MSSVPIPPDSAATAVQNRANVLAKLFLNRSLPDGTLVAVRRNLNSNLLMPDGSVDTLQTVHDTRNPQKGWDGEALGYDVAVTVTNAFFGVDQEARNDIATGKIAKTPMAAVVGRIKQNANSTEGVTIRFNPKREHLFVDPNGYAVRGADEVTVLGRQAFARGTIYYYTADDAPQQIGDAPSSAKIKPAMQLTLTPTGDLESVKSNPRSPDDESTPHDSADLFSVRWIDEGNEDFADNDLFDAYEDPDGKVYGLSLRGEWLPIGDEGVSWEWANYGGLKKPKGYKGEYIRLDTLGRSAYREKAVKQNGRRSKIAAPRRWYWVNHTTGVVVGPMPHASAVRMMEHANLEHAGDTSAVSEATMLRDYNGGHYKAPVKKNGWKARVRDVYASVDELLAYDEIYGILNQLKWDGTVEELWEANPMLSGSVTPGKLRIVKERNGRVPKPNGFKHARPFGGSVGREQYHVHFEDAKGVIYYYAGNTDRGVKLEREYAKAKKFTAAKAAALAKKLGRLYANVRHDGGHFYAESA